MSTVNLSPFERDPQWSITLVVIQDQPYVEGVCLVHRPTGRYCVVVTGINGDIHSVIEYGRL